MGMSSLLGILDGLGNILSSVFSAMISWMVKQFIVPIVKGLITGIMMVIKYCASALFLEVSQFLLGLIDFVEILFRALAGLPSASGDLSISMTLGNHDGDLLLSMLTSHEVMQAFYATAIVGLFLLMITTIFQMIKVEYTTEGAQNSKTGIIGKSLKSLCNMLIIPILCLMGVYIGNQVLDLIDTATGGGGNNKISGQLWITAATTAMVKEGSFEKYLISEGITWNDSGASGGLLGLGIEVGLARGLVSAWNDMYGGQYEDKPLGDTAVDDNYRQLVEGNFAQEVSGYSFYSERDIIKYYNPFEINYIVLIFGACIIIKCLFYTCFGLIDRLYQCVALFIVMPMVVGMSPVKDSLGSWRGKFMSKALSAYGTVISLNLFFIIVKVMLNIDIEFTSGGFLTNDIGLLGIFSTTFMEDLIKSLMVIVGCLMIEKLAGDLGGYFGAGNAMSEGKGLAKDATAGVQKAAKAGIGVAKGGMSLAIKGAKAGVGLADKLTGGGVTRTTNAVKNSGFGKGAKKVGDFIKSVPSLPGKGARALTNAIGKGGGESGAYVRAQLKAREAQDAYDIEEAKLNNIEQEYGKDSEEYKAQSEIKADADKERRKAKNDEHNAEQDLRHSFKGPDGDKALKKADKAVAKAKSKADYFANEEKEHKDQQIVKDAQRTARKEGVRQLFEDKFGAEAMFNTFAPKSLQGLRKDYNSAVKTAMDASPEGQAMMGQLGKIKKDAAEAAFDKRNASAIETRNLYQTELILKTTNEKLQVTNEETNKELQKLRQSLEDTIKKKDAADKDNNPALANALANRIASLQEQMSSKVGRELRFDSQGHLDVHEDLKVDFKMDPGFMKKIEAEIKKGMKMDDVMTQINEEFKRIGLTDKDTLTKIYKALEELKNNFGGK